MIIPAKEYPLQKILMKQKKTKCRMRSGRECSRPSRNQQPSYLAVISDADSRMNMRKLYLSWSNGDEEGVSHSSSAQTVYFNEGNRQFEDNKIQKDPVTGPQNNNRDVAQVGKRAPQVDLESFDGNPPKYTYFMSMFRESIEKKIEDPKGRLTQLIQHTRGEAKDLIKNFINDRPEYGYNNAMTILHTQYGKPTHFTVII